MKDTILVDLDGTLCNHDHRLHLALAGQWDEYNALCVDDAPNEDVFTFIKLLSSFKNLFQILIVTGRDETFRKQTEEWLLKHNILADAVLMRPKWSYAHDYELKIKMIEEFFGSKEAVLERIAFALDDRDKVIETFRDYGIHCWQVRQWRY